MPDKKEVGKDTSVKTALGLFLLVVVVGAAYYGYQASQIPQVQPTPTMTASSTKKVSIVVKWLDHSSFMIKATGKTIYIDPYAGEYVDKADLILVTHSHSDHLNTTWINKVRRDDTVIIAPADCVVKIGGTVKSLKPGEKLTVGEIVIEAVEAYNIRRFRSPGNPYHPKGFGVGYLLSTGGKTIYHAGDTDFIPEMKELRNVYLVLLPCDGTFNMNSSEVVEAALAIRPKFLMPMHLRNTDPTPIKKEVEAKSETKVLLLKPGEVFGID